MTILRGEETMTLIRRFLCGLVVLLLPRVHPCRILAADAGVQAGEAITKRRLQGGLAAATVSSTIAR